MRNFLGLSAFVLIWLQVIQGNLFRPLANFFGPTRFLNWSVYSSIFSIFFALTHSGLFLLAIIAGGQLSGSGQAFNFSIFVGLAALYLMIATFITYLFGKNSSVIKNWSKIHWFNQIIFWSVSIHAVLISSKIQTSWLAYFFYFMAASVILTGFYNKIYKLNQKYEKRRHLHDADLRVLQNDKGLF